MKDYQEIAAQAVADYRAGKKRLAHYQWELAKLKMMEGRK